MAAGSVLLIPPTLRQSKLCQKDAGVVQAPKVAAVMENYEINSDCGEGEDEEEFDSSVEGDGSEDESDHADGSGIFKHSILAIFLTSFVKFDQTGIECIAQVECYKEESCVDIDFSKSGDTLYTICGQYEVVMVDVNSRQMHNFGNLCNDDENSNLTNIKCINHWYFCTGDNKGQVKIWDSRHIKPFKETGFLRRSSDEVNDYLSDMIVNKDGNRIATASGAGVVTVFDTRKLNIINQNGESKSDLTSLASVSNDRELVAGSLRGDLVFTSWQGSQHKSHIFNALHNVACNNIKAVTERLIVTSWDDNFIRLFGVYPHKFQGFVGLTTFPAEFLDIDSHKKCLLSSGFDKKLWLWDVQDLERKAKKSS
uniref:WD repeat-containing protein 55 homolog n=1 Tax=Rhodnius prolixus TaxID=13249 RepID=T1HGY7_RHOPR